MSLLRRVLLPLASRLTSGTSHLRNLRTSANVGCIQQHYGKINAYHLQRAFSTSATKEENAAGDKVDGPKAKVAIKLRGIPFNATKADVQTFLKDCKIYNGLNGIHLAKNAEGRPAGEAFVEIFADADADAFLQKDKEYLGHRYVEVSTVDRVEFEWHVRDSKPQA